MGEDLIFYHGGLPENFDFSQLDPFRLAQKQQKRGRDYAGFYMLDEGQLDGAKRYANMNNGALHQINLANDARIKDLESIERIKQGVLQQYANEGYDVLRGPNIFGKNEYVLLNPNKITNTKIVDDSLMNMIKNGASRVGKIAGKTLGAVGNLGMLYDAYNDMQKYNDPYRMWGA